MILPRPEVITLTESEHGGVPGANASNRFTRVLDFSANTNPFPPPDGVLEALQRVPLNRYPDRDASELRLALSAKLGVSLESIIAGNGSSELLYLIALAYFRPLDTVLIVGPTYTEYARVSALMGARVVDCNSVPETGFRPPLGAIEAALKSLQPRAVFLCNPNNPTGQTAPAFVLKQWISTFPGTLFIVDEAYVEFCEPVETLLPLVRDNLVVLRSLTKAFGLAGLRLGYAVSHPQVIRVLACVRPPWSVNAAAQGAGVAVLRATEDIERSIETLRAEGRSLMNEIGAIGFPIVPTAAHFFLMQVRCAGLLAALAEAGILLRDCRSFGLPQFLRISPRDSADNAFLCRALARIRHSC
jgi:histidinol-phosphate aminotransferase